MKKNIEFIKIASCILFTWLVVNGCKKADEVRTYATKPEKSLESYANLSVVHLYNDTVYTLGSQFVRQAGEELIIDEGTVIKVNPLVPGVASSGNINILPGGLIKANGTRNNPVVFTSNAAAGTQFYNWGGINIQGKAKNNSRGINGDTTDFSGVLKYVRIEFAALTLDAVGSSSIIENIMVSYTNIPFQQSASSSFIFYGGSVNCRNLISYACGGPVDFYITNGYNGKMQNIIAYRHPFFGNTGNTPTNALAGLYITNNRNNSFTAKPFTYPVISNVTILGPDMQNGSSINYTDTSLNAAALVTSGNAFFRIRNSLLLGFPAGGFYVGDSLTTLNILNYQSELKNTIIHCNNNSRVFYLRPNSFRPYTSNDLKVYMLQSSFNNKLFLSSADFKFKDPFNYDIPNLFPENNSPVLTGADFSGLFSDPFFTTVTYCGAVGNDNWMEGWVNFTPLKTNYNFPGYHK